MVVRTSTGWIKDTDTLLIYIIDHPRKVVATQWVSQSLRGILLRQCGEKVANGGQCADHDKNSPR